MKLAFVVQRYGEQISGGAELHCRLIAEQFALRGDDVHVYTTCAIDYMTWEDVYAPGIESLNGVSVHRFRVDEKRDIPHFNRLSEEVYGKRASTEKQEEWMRAQGPNSSKLFEALKKEKDEYDWMLFYNYLYCPTYFGLPVCREKAILVPMVHDEPPVFLEIFRKIFTGCRALMYNTEEERNFIQTQFDVSRIPSRVVGMWAPEPLEKSPDDAFFRKVGSKNFIVYIGRIDASKGCEEIANHFILYKKAHPSDLKLLFMGKGDMKIPDYKDIVAWGFASDTEKWQALRGALTTVVPSLYESLSISLLESFVVNRPVIVNGNCAVTRAHCVKSNGGLWYRDAEEFGAALELLRLQPDTASRMGINGSRYVTKNYGLDIVMEKYDSVFRELTR